MDIPQEPIWVDTPRELAELCQRWRQQAAIAVDTEFMRSDTFYPIAGLIQIGDGRGCYLIDPLAFDDLEPLAELMADEAVTKVLHACSEDLEVFAALLGVLPSPVFDTQIGAAFAGLGFSLGYAGLARELLGVEIPKGETRSDWLQRPLSAAQLKYAALDVAHLLIVYGKLLTRLKEQGRMEWVRDDCARLVEAARAEPDFDRHYHKLGQAWRLNDQALPVLQRLCRWREETARERDLPRNRLMKDQPLQEIARQQPTSLNKLRRIDGIPKRTVNDDGDHLLDLIREAREAAPVERPPTPLGRAQGDFLKSLKRYVRERAEALGLPPELLIRKKEYEALVRSGLKEGEFRLPERLRGWRYEVIGRGLLDRARQYGKEETQ